MPNYTSYLGELERLHEWLIESIDGATESQGHDARLTIFAASVEWAIARFKGLDLENAQLMVAKRDLLQALLNLVGTMCAADGSDMEADLDAIDASVCDARAAIAKATEVTQ